MLERARARSRWQRRPAKLLIWRGLQSNPKCSLAAFVPVKGLSEVFCYLAFVMLFLNLASTAYKLSLPRKNLKAQVNVIFWKACQILLQGAYNEFTYAFVRKPRVVFIFTVVTAVQTHSLCGCSFSKYLPSTHCALAILLGPMEDYKNEIG